MLWVITRIIDTSSNDCENFSLAKGWTKSPPAKRSKKWPRRPKASSHEVTASRVGTSSFGAFPLSQHRGGVGTVSPFFVFCWPSKPFLALPSLLNSILTISMSVSSDQSTTVGRVSWTILSMLMIILLWARFSQCRYHSQRMGSWRKENSMRTQGWFWSLPRRVRISSRRH